MPPSGAPDAVRAQVVAEQEMAVVGASGAGGKNRRGGGPADWRQRGEILAPAAKPDNIRGFHLTKP